MSSAVVSALPTCAHILARKIHSTCAHTAPCGASTTGVRPRLHSSQAVGGCSGYNRVQDGRLAGGKKHGDCILLGDLQHAWEGECREGGRGGQALSTAYQRQIPPPPPMHTADAHTGNTPRARRVCAPHTASSRKACNAPCSVGERQGGQSPAPRTCPLQSRSHPQSAQRGPPGRTGP